MTEVFSLAGRTALITGATRGIGLAMAEAMARAGAAVIVNGRDPATVGDAVEGLRSAGHTAFAAPFDVTDEAAVRAAVAAAEAEHDGLDIVVANAGINHRAALAEFPLEAWRRVIDTNLTAAFVLARAAAPAMVARGHGRLIMTGSITSILGRPAVPAYTAAKGGLEALTRALAVELGPRGVTCNAIAPGYIATALTAPLQSDPAFDAMVRRRTPLGRWGRADEIANVAVFLASDAASYVNGHLLVADGGMTIAL